MVAVSGGRRRLRHFAVLEKKNCVARIRIEVLNLSVLLTTDPVYIPDCIRLCAQAWGMD